MKPYIWYAYTADVLDDNGGYAILLGESDSTETWPLPGQNAKYDERLAHAQAIVCWETTGRKMPVSYIGFFTRTEQDFEAGNGYWIRFPGGYLKDFMGKCFHQGITYESFPQWRLFGIKSVQTVPVSEIFMALCKKIHEKNYQILEQALAKGNKHLKLSNSGKTIVFSGKQLKHMLSFNPREARQQLNAIGA